MIHVSSKCSLLLLVFIGLVFFIGNYFDEAIQAIDYESYLFVDHPDQHELQKALTQDTNDHHDIFSPGFSCHLVLLLQELPGLLEAKYRFFFLTPYPNEPFYSINPPLQV